MYTPLFKMNQWHKERYDRVYWASVDVYLYGEGKEESPSLKNYSLYRFQSKMLLMPRFNWEVSLYLFTYNTQEEYKIKHTTQ